MRDDKSTAITGRLPLHIQVSEMLAREVQAGLLPVGTKLAPERDMAIDLNISVGTLRKALADLTQKGLLERIHGSGNYIKSDGGSTTIYGFFRLELLEGGGLPTAEILSVSKLKKPASLPDFGSSERAFRIRRVRSLGEVKAAVEEIWLDGSYAKDLKASKLSESLYQHYKQALNLLITRADDYVGVAPPPIWKPDNFISNASTWGFVERISYDQSNQKAEYSRNWFDPNIARYVARLT